MSDLGLLQKNFPEPDEPKLLNRDIARSFARDYLIKAVKLAKQYHFSLKEVASEIDHEFSDRKDDPSELRAVPSAARDFPKGEEDV